MATVERGKNHGVGKKNRDARKHNIKEKDWLCAAREKENMELTDVKQNGEDNECGEKCTGERMSVGTAKRTDIKTQSRWKKAYGSVFCD